MATKKRSKDFIKKLYANVLVLDSVAIVDSVVDKKGTREGSDGISELSVF